LSGKDFRFTHFALSLSHLVFLVLGAELNHGWNESLRYLVVGLHIVLQLPRMLVFVLSRILRLKEWLLSILILMLHVVVVHLLARILLLLLLLLLVLLV
jgi:hypothetical protein